MREILQHVCAVQDYALEQAGKTDAKKDVERYEALRSLLAALDHAFPQALLIPRLRGVKPLP
jgi:hypothetical protein